MDLAGMEQIAADLSALTARVGALESQPSPDSVTVPNNYFITNKGVQNNTVLAGEPSGPVFALLASSPPTIATGERPVDVTVSPDGENVYVINQTLSTITCYTRNTATGNLTFLETVAIGLVEPRKIRVSPDGAHVYVACFHSPPTGGIAIFARGEGGVLTPASTFLVGAQTVCAQPSPSSELLLHGFINGLGLYEITGGTLTPLETLAVVGRPVACFAPDEDHVYARIESKEIQAFSLAGGKLTALGAPVATAEAGEYLQVSPDGANLYVACLKNMVQFAIKPDATLSAMSPPEVAVTDELFTGNSFAIAPDGRALYSTGNSDLAQFPRSTLTGTLGKIPPETIVTEAFATAISPDGRSVYVVNSFANELRVFATE